MSKIGHFFHHLGHELHHLGHEIDSGFHHLGHELHHLGKELVHDLKDPLFIAGLACDVVGLVAGPEMEAVGMTLMAGRTAARAGRAIVDARKAVKTTAKALHRADETKKQLTETEKDNKTETQNTVPSMGNLDIESQKILELILLQLITSLSSVNSGFKLSPKPAFETNGLRHFNGVDSKIDAGSG